MIFTKLYEFCFYIINLITSFIDLPPFDVSVSDMINSLFDYMTSGLQILSCYTNIGFLLVLLGIVISVDIAINVYHFVMWILKKIPMASIE